jgi:leucine dehydrogenase
MVIGSANNQLASPSVAEELHARGILYAPDYVANGGGVIAVCGLEELRWSAAELDAALVGIGDRLGEIFRRADAQSVSPVAVADAMVAARLA